MLITNWTAKEQELYSPKWSAELILPEGIDDSLQCNLFFSRWAGCTSSISIRSRDILCSFCVASNLFVLFITESEPSPSWGCPKNLSWGFLQASVTFPFWDTTEPGTLGSVIPAIIWLGFILSLAFGMGSTKSDCHQQLAQKLVLLSIT